MTYDMHGAWDADRTDEPPGPAVLAGRRPDATLIAPGTQKYSIDNAIDGLDRPATRRTASRAASRRTS